jgi:hypothetical protein
MPYQYVRETLKDGGKLTARLHDVCQIALKKSCQLPANLTAIFGLGRGDVERRCAGNCRSVAARIPVKSECIERATTTEGPLLPYDPHETDTLSDSGTCRAMERRLRGNIPPSC